MSKIAKKPKEDNTPPPRTFPRAFKSAESSTKVKAAQKVIAAMYPTMSVDDINDYLIEVGAGRYIALANYTSPRQEISPKSKARK